MFEKELAIARRLADQAGALILEFYKQEIIAEEKLGIDNFYEPVTEADKEASRLIVRGLSKAYPDDYVLSEEEDDRPADRLATDRSWMIDPIDGTAGFVRKDGDFSVQIGLAEGGEPKLGVVHLPFHGITYFASDGGGAFAEYEGSEPVALGVTSIGEFAKMRLAVTRNHWSSKMDRVIREFKFGELTRRGSVGLKIGLIAERSCDIYIHTSPRTKLWDTCAPQIILEEAGGLLTDLFGHRIRYDAADLQNHNGILASNAAAHEDAVARLRPLLAEFGRDRVEYRKRAPSI